MDKVQDPLYFRLSQIKKHNKIGMANSLYNKIPELISCELQKVSSQLYEGKKQLSNYDGASKTLKKLVDKFLKEVSSLKKTITALENKSNTKGNQPSG